MSQHGLDPKMAIETTALVTTVESKDPVVQLPSQQNVKTKMLESANRKSKIASSSIAKRGTVRVVPLARQPKEEDKLAAVATSPLRRKDVVVAPINSV